MNSLSPQVTTQLPQAQATVAAAAQLQPTLIQVGQGSEVIQGQDTQVHAGGGNQSGLEVQVCGVKCLKK